MLLSPWQGRNIQREQARKIKALHVRMRLQRWCANEECEREEVEKVARMVKRLLADEEGATAVEYGMMVALIAAVIVLVVQTLGTQINDAFQTIVDALP